MTAIDTAIDNIIVDLGASACATAEFTTAENKITDALSEIDSLNTDIVKLDNEIKDINLDSYLEYDDVLNLYASLIIGILMLLPMIFLGVAWPLQQLKRLEWLPPAVYIVFASISTAFMGLLSTSILPLLIAYSDGCNDLDTFLKRTINEDSFNFYVDCTNPTTVFTEFQTFLTDAVTGATAASGLLVTADAACPDNLSGIIDDVDSVIASVNTDLTALLQCNKLNGLYTSAKQDACGSNTYNVILHLHQGIFGKFVPRVCKTFSDQTY